PWVQPGFEVVPQVPGGLGERLAGAFDAVGGPALLIGMDTPQVTRTSLASAAATLERAGVDAVLGGTPDGGYWTIGLRRPDPRVFEDVPMSSARTARVQRMRLHALGLRWRELEHLRDVGAIEGAVRGAAMALGRWSARALGG